MCVCVCVCVCVYPLQEKATLSRFQVAVLQLKMCKDSGQNGGRYPDHS